MYYPKVNEELELVFDHCGEKLDVTITELLREGMLTKVIIKESGEIGFVVFSKDGSYTWVATEVVEVEEKEPWQQ